MEITNRLNLPQYLADWLKSDKYDYNHDPNTISATGLMKPIRANLITTRHLSELEVDVSDLVASRFGNAIHDSIERIETPGTGKEQRVSRKMMIGDTEYTVTGKYDILVEENGLFTLRDIKTTSVWAYIYGGKDDDYREQLSIYRWLLSVDHKMNPIAYIDFFFTDWQSSKARNEDNYPKSRIHPGYRIELLSLEETEAMIREKLTALKLYKDVPDDRLPQCTKEELWAEEDTYAVYKIGNKRATKVCDSKETAEQYQQQNNIKGYIQYRQGRVKRCNYCSAAPFCNQFESLKQQNLID